MSASPLVTFVTPAFNAADTIDKTIQSIRSQTYPHWEWRIVDDGSTDETYALLQSEAERDPRIKITRQANAGPASARNRAIRDAQGEWLMFHDADDWLHPDFLTRMLAAAARGANCDLVACTFLGVDEQGAALRTHWVRDLSDPFPELARTCPFSPIAVIVRRAPVQALGGFDETLITCEDWDLWQRLARAGHRFASLSQTLAFYRSRRGSLTRKTQRLIDDSQVVIRRGHGVDPRAAPDAVYARGADPRGLTDALAHSALYFAATGLLIGADPGSFFKHLPDLSCWAFDSAIMADVIVDAAAYGLAGDRALIARDWQQASQRFDALIAALGAAGVTAQRCESLRALIEAHVRGAAAFSDGFQSAHVQAVSIDLATPPATLAATEKSIVVGSVHGSGLWLGAFQAAASDHALTEGVYAALRAAPAGRVVRASRALGRVGFWARVATHGLDVVRAKNDRRFWAQFFARQAASVRWAPQHRRATPVGKGARASGALLLLVRAGGAALIAPALRALQRHGFQIVAIHDWVDAAKAAATYGPIAMIGLDAEGEVGSERAALTDQALPFTVFSADPTSGHSLGWRLPADAIAWSSDELHRRASEARAAIAGQTAGVLLPGGRVDGALVDVLRREGFSYAVAPIAGRASVDADPFALHCVTLDGFTPEAALERRLNLTAFAPRP